MRKFIFIVLLLFIPSNLMAYEDFTTYTEEDPNNRFTVTSSKIDVVGLLRNEDAWVVKDKGVNHFDGDFEHLTEGYVNSVSDVNGRVNCWLLANVIDDVSYIGFGSAEDGLGVYLGRGTGTNSYIAMNEFDDVDWYQDIFVGNTNTLYYLKIKRDEAVGTYGTMYCYIYDDAERTNLVDTLTLALHTSKKDYRYIYGADSWNIPGTQSFTGYTQNLDLQEAAPPEVPRVQSQILILE